MSKVIVLASHNKGKVREFQEILEPFGYEVKSVADFGHHEEPEENGKTYRENSYIKSKYYFDVLGVPVIADDSGIEIEALGDHFPGVRSARWREDIAKEYGDGPEMVNQHIIEKMEGMKNREAAFYDSICLIEEGGKASFFEGKCEGLILDRVTGENGFGYDPIFFSYEGKLEWGTAKADAKNKVSHRGKAIQKLIEYFKQKEGK